MPRARASSAKTEINLGKIARACRTPADLVRRILREDPKLTADRTTKDRVFKTARRLGYDFHKLRMSKRLDLRLETIAEILRRIEENSSWNRAEILAHLKSAADLADRVQSRMYGQDR